MIAGTKRLSITQILWNELAGDEPDAPIFWCDSSRTYEPALHRLTLPSPPERLSSEAALRLRLEVDERCDPLQGRLFYVVESAALDPIAELVRCFGQRRAIDMRELLRLCGFELSAESVEFARAHAAAFLVNFDAIPQGAFEKRDLIGGLAAAVCGLSVVDAVDVAISWLSRLSAEYSKLAPDSTAEERLRVEEDSVVARYLSDGFEIDRDALIPGLLRRAVLADLVRTQEGKELVGQLLPSTTADVSRRLADRVASDTKLYKSLRDKIESAVRDLGIDATSLKTETLVGVRLVPLARDVLVERLKSELTQSPADEALQRLEAFAPVLATDDIAPAYKAALQCSRAIVQHCEDVAVGGREPEWFFERYAADWFHIDGSYRQAMAGIAGGLRQSLESSYRSWLRDSNAAFGEALSKRQSWIFPNSQRELGKSFQGVAPHTAIVVMDALRYELARELVARLGRGYEADYNVAIASLPSITEVGMSALTPMSDDLRLAVDGKKLRVYVGQRETTQKSARDKAWEAAGFRVLAPADVPMLQPGDQRVVVFHGAVDALGEKLQADAFGHFEQLILELARLFKELLAKDYEIIATADHGFLTLPSDNQSGLLGVGVTADEVKKRRYRVSPSDELEPPAITRTAKELGFAGDVSVGFAPAASVLSAHGALTFIHGGISLQELVIPCFRIRAKQKPTSTKWRVEFPERLLARVVRVMVSPASKSDLGKVAELSVWRGSTKVAVASATLNQVDEPTKITAWLDEEEKPGELVLKVGLPGAAPIDQKNIAFEPQRD